MAPFTASDGIHDTATTLDSIFIALLRRSVVGLTPSSARRAHFPKGTARHRRGGAAPPPGVHGCPLAPIRQV